MGDLRIDHFSGGVGGRFRLRAGDRSLELMLDKAEPMNRSVREAGAFRLEFVGPADPPLPQGTYPFEVGDEEHDIFIVPVAREAAGFRYEAIFY
jgi:hypothetical protein